MRLVDADDIAPLLNRSLLIVRVKIPFIEWAKSLDEEGPKVDLEAYEPNAYLVDGVEGPDQLGRVLKRAWKAIFEHELAVWHRDPGDWPRRRGLTMFREWFDVELHPGVHDIGTDPITET